MELFNNPALLGAMIGVGGGLLSQLITHLFTQRRERIKQRGERLERMVSAVYDAETWIRERHDSGKFSLNFIMPPDASKVRMFQQLYFPELRKETDRVLNAMAMASNDRGNQGQALSEFQAAVATLTERVAAKVK